MQPDRLRGVIAAVATPLGQDATISHQKLIAHCGWLLDNGCDGINLLGTTGEATSFSVEQRLATMQAVARSRLPLDRFMVGTGAAALADASQLTAAARDFGFAGALLLPPFYYKPIDHDGLTTYVETVIKAVEPRDLKLYLYHYPQLSGVPYAIDAVEHLHRAYPEQILGLKDSSGDLDYSAELARRLPRFAVFPSAEGAIGRAKEFNFAGCISATVNVTAPLVGRAWADLGSPAASEALAQATAIRQALASVPLVAAVKWAVSRQTGDRGWTRLVPPLRSLNLGEEAALQSALAKTTFAQLTRASARPLAAAK